MTLFVIAVTAIFTRQNSVLASLLFLDLALVK
jgi:hypothetical protein